MASKLNQPVSDRTVVTVIAIVVALALAGWAGRTWYRKATAGRPMAALDVKRSIWKFLAKQTGEKNFKVPRDISSNSVVPATAALTNSAGGIRTSPRLPRVALARTGPSLYFRTNQEQAATYPEIYRFVGQQLALAEQFLASEDEAQRGMGLLMASEAVNYTRTNAMNLWLSARICEAYLWPNLALVEATNRPLMTADTLLNLCDTTFKQAGETNNILRNYELMVTKTKRPSDSTRYRLAQLYQDAGEDAKALAQLKQTKNYKIKQVEFEIRNLEKRLSTKKPQ